MNTLTTALILDADGMIVHGERFSTRLARDYGILWSIYQSLQVHTDFEQFKREVEKLL